VAPYVRTVATSSGAQAVQIVYSSRRGSRSIEHIGSAHDEVELELLKTVARQRLSAGQGTLDLGLDGEEPVRGGPLPITSSRMGHLVDALRHSYRVLGLDGAAGGDEVFEQLVLARIIEPTSKFDSTRVLAEAGLSPASYATVKRRLPVFATEPWREKLAAACAAHAALGPASLVLYDVSTLYFETHEGDGFREPGFSKERRLEPQITIGLLTDQAGFPLMLNAFEGNKAETTTMLPVIQAFQAAHHLQDVTVVADAGMVSMSNQKAIEAAGLSFILGARTPDVPYVVKQWRAAHPDQEIPARACLRPAMAGQRHRRPPRPGHLLPLPRRQRPTDPARHRPAGRQGRTRRRRQDAGQTQPVRPALRRQQKREPHPRGQGSRPGRDQGLCRCRGYAERRHLIVGGDRGWAWVFGIITGSGARRAAGLRGGSPRPGCRVAWCARARCV
jgi:hypothetical protein